MRKIFLFLFLFLLYLLVFYGCSKKTREEEFLIGKWDVLEYSEKQLDTSTNEMVVNDYIPLEHGYTEYFEFERDGTFKSIKKEDQNPGDVYTGNYTYANNYLYISKFNKNFEIYGDLFSLTLYYVNEDNSSLSIIIEKISN